MTAQTNLPKKTITLGGTSLVVQVATTEVEREQGLSLHAPLMDGEGMLFVFDTPSDRGIWMKDMLFPLDIVWANKDGVVTTSLANVATSTYPQVLRPKTPDALYVVELPSGFLQKNGIREGARLTI